MFGRSPSISPDLGGSLPLESDESLFLRHLEGDARAFRELIDRHGDDLLRFLQRLTGDAQLAEDAFQDAFLQAHVSGDSFDRSRKFRPWLFTIAANKARDSIRKKKRRSEFDLHAPLPGGASSGQDRPSSFVDLLAVKTDPVGSGLDAADQDRQVQSVLDSLPEHLREILLLAYFQRLSYSQISDDLDIPLGTVKSRLHAAVAAFAQRWNAALNPTAKP